MRGLFVLAGRSLQALLTLCGPMLCDELSRKHSERLELSAIVPWGEVYLVDRVYSTSRPSMSAIRVRNPGH